MGDRVADKNLFILHILAEILPVWSLVYEYENIFITDTSLQTPNESHNDNIG